MSANPETMSTRCPTCRKPAQADFTPFCSQGCKDRDLLRWLDEGYRIPVRAHEEEGDSGLDSEGEASL